MEYKTNREFFHANLNKKCSSKYLEKFYQKLDKLKKSENPKYIQIMEVFVDDIHIYDQIFNNLDNIKFFVEKLIKKKFDIEKFYYISKIFHEELVSNIFQEFGKVQNLFNDFDFLNKKNIEKNKFFNESFQKTSTTSLKNKNTLITQKSLKIIFSKQTIIKKLIILIV